MQEAFGGLVGWEQSAVEENKVADDLLTSESGLYYQQAHPLLTLENVRSVLAEGADMTEACKRAVNIGVATVANRILQDATLAGASKQLFEHKTLFDAVGRLNNRIANAGKVVGYEITPLRGLGVTMEVHKMGLQMYGGGGNVKVYLFNTSNAEPIAETEVEFGGSKGYEWKNVEWVLPMGGVSAGGRWFVVYWQNDLPDGVEAVNIAKDWRQEPCGSCNSGNREQWRVMMRYIRVSPFEVEVEDGWSDEPTLWDLQDMIYRPQQCFGLNMELSIGCDLTEFLIGQRGLLAGVLQKQVAVDLLRRIAYNPEVNVNRNQVNASRQEVVGELEGNGYTRGKGLLGELEKAYKAVEIDLSGMDSACMACKKKGVRYGIV